MKFLKILGMGVLGILIFLGGFHYLRAQGIVAPWSPAAPVVVVPVEEIQYRFEKGRGLLNVAIEDVFMGVGMVTGTRRLDGQGMETPFSGSLDFEMASKKKQARLQMDRIRLIERTKSGDGRVFEPDRIYDSNMEKGQEPQIRFPETKGKFPFVWETGMTGYVYFVFADLPADIDKADLVITYNGKFPEKKHIAYYEDRFPVERKTYRREK